MKKSISTIILEDGLGRSTLGLTDAPLAVQVNHSDGLVTFREGHGVGRIHGWVLTPESVVRFRVTRVEGLDAICLDHLRRGEYATHVVGHVKDTISAQMWVDRVNALYVITEGRDEQNALDLDARYRDSPVVHDILETEKNIILPGSFQYNGTIRPDRAGHPILTPWEDAHVRRTLELLETETGRPTNAIETEILGFMPHNYNWLTRQVHYEEDFFNRRITQPLELIWDRKQRRDKISVIPFCYAESFALVYRTNSPFGAHWKNLRDPQTFGSFDSFISTFQDIATKHGLLICAPSEQSVFYSFFDAHHDRKFDVDALHCRATLQELAWWLWNTPLGGVACDIGDVYPLIDAVNQHHGGGPNPVLSCQHIPYERPVGVGFCYRNDDQVWGEIQRQSLLHVLQSDDRRIRDDLDQFRERIQNLGLRLAA